MCYSARIMRAAYCRLLLLIYIVGCSLLFVAASDQSRPLPGKQLHEVKFYRLDASGEVAEVQRETGATGNENMSLDSVARPQDTAVFMRLSGGKAKLRFKKSDPIELLVELPSGATPQQFELLRFERRGPTRMVYLQAFGMPSSTPHWNTISFRAGQLPDGRWKFRPAMQLSAGEYCFSPRFSDVNFCFGVEGE